MNNKGRNSKIERRKFLEEIIERKKEELQKNRKSQNSSSFENQRTIHADISDKLSFLQTFSKDTKRSVRVIAEVKFASPTNPGLGSPEDLVSRVKQYEQAGADAISFITEKQYFNGDTHFIPKIKKTVALPILQKDFVIDPQQIYEAKEIGSDALLLIARLVDKKTLGEFVDLCFSLGIEPVVEINSEKDLEKAISTKTHIIAVNARDLENFTIDIVKACHLMKKIPDQFVILGFSGIHSSHEVAHYETAGAKGVLVGTSLMRTNDIHGFLADLRG